jgi:hypothetical protein
MGLHVQHDHRCQFGMEIANNTTFTGAGAATKKATVQAWAYWWKGFAYARIGSIYYAGLIQNATTTSTTTNGNYVTKEAIIAESNTNFDKAATALDAATSATDYADVVGKLIPSFYRKEKAVYSPQLCGSVISIP